MIRLRFAPVLAALVLGNACSPSADDLRSQANEAIAAGDPSRALTALERIEAPTREDLVRRIEALTLAGRTSEALERLAALDPDHAERDGLLQEICAKAAVRAIDAEDAPAALAALSPCDDAQTLDLFVFRMHAQVLAGDEPSPDDAEYVLRELRRAPPGRATDEAAEHLERLTVRWAESRAESPEEQLTWLGIAWRVGRDEALAERIIETAMREGDARITSDPQTATSLYEFVTLERIRGFRAPDDVREQGARQISIAMAPIFEDGFRRQFTRKFGELYAEQGIWDAEADRFRLPLDGDRELTFATWFYRTTERPMPLPPPPLLSYSGLCGDGATTCELAVRDVSDLFRQLDGHEARWFEVNGIPESYQLPDVPQRNREGDVLPPGPPPPLAPVTVPTGE